MDVARQGEKGRFNKVAEICLRPDIFVSVLLTFMVFWQFQWLGQRIDFVRHLIVAWGVVIIGYLLVTNRNFFKVPGIWLGPVFVFGALTTLAINYPLNAPRQLGSIFPVLVGLTLIYPLGFKIGKSEEPARKLSRILIPPFLAVFIQSLASVVIALTGYGLIYVVGSHKYYFGMVAISYGEHSLVSLLYGVNRDPNFASLYSFFGIICSLWLLSYRHVLFENRITQKFFVWLAAISLPLHIIFMVLANSRGALVGCIVSGFFYLLISGFKTYEGGKSIPKRLGISIVRALAIAVILLVSIYGIHAVFYKYYSLPFMSHTRVATVAEVALSEETDGSASTEEEPGGDAQITVGKGGFSSSSRLYIWREVLDLWSHHKVFGVGPGNLMHYAKTENIGGYGEKNYLQNRYISHNSYLELLVRYGLFGFIPYFAFFVTALVIVIKSFSRRGVDQDDVLWVSLWTFYMSVLFFLTGLFTRLTFFYILILLVIGYLAEKKKTKPCYTSTLQRL